MSDEVDFLFDVVVTRVQLEKEIREPKLLDAVVKFAGNSLTVTNSRINVSDFENNRQFTLSKSPDELRDLLATNGLPVSVRYNKSSQGSAVIDFPDTFLDKISPTMNDLFYEDTVPLMRRDGITVGSVSLRMVLIVKCAEREQEPGDGRSSSKRGSRRSTRRSTATGGSSRATAIEPTPPKKEEKVECTGLGSAVNPQDVIFVIGDPDPLLKMPDEPCAEAASEEGDERLRLDLLRYKSLNNRRVIFPDDEPCPKEKPSFAQLKRLTKEYSQIIDSVTEKVRRIGILTDPPSEKTTVTPRTGHAVPDERWIPVPLGSDEEDYGVKPIRFCPVCLCSMSWLPRLASCPQCHCRPRPVLRAGHPALMKMTADEIVVEQLVRPQAPDGAEDFCLPPCEAASRRIKKGHPPMVDSDSDAECPPCRCTCKEGKTCAHCRIRLLCEDIFEGEDKPEEEREKRPTVIPQPRSSEDFCVIPEAEDDDRPYLARVFSEMKSLYVLHDTKKMLEIKKRGHELIQSQQTGFNAHLPGSFERQKAGHKHCLPSENPVSRRHGWDWPRSREAKKFGWRPGAILRAAEQVMRFFLTSKEDRDPCSKIIADYEKLQPKRRSPILNICKRDGEIFVTLQGKDLKQKPITFRIVKSQLAVALRQIKRALKDQGFQKCTCHKSLMLCTCRDAFEKFELNRALRRECQRRLIEPCPEKLVLTDTSISDLEFDLDVDPLPRRCATPVMAIQNTVNHGTQTVPEAKRMIPPLYPAPDSPYWRAFDCAAGDRYMGTAFGDNEETVFEDGIFGYRGGGQHGKATTWRDKRVWNEGGGAPLRIGTARNTGDPHRFGRSVWRGVPKKILRKMSAKSLIR